MRSYSLLALGFQEGCARAFTSKDYQFGVTVLHLATPRAVASICKEVCRVAGSRPGPVPDSCTYPGKQGEFGLGAVFPHGNYLYEIEVLGREDNRGNERLVERLQAQYQHALLTG